MLRGGEVYCKHEHSIQNVCMLLFTRNTSEWQFPRDDQMQRSDALVHVRGTAQGRSSDPQAQAFADGCSSAGVQ